MAIASGSAVQISYLEELTTPGQVEPSGTAQNLRAVSESLNQTVESTKSAEIRADRRVSDSVLTSGSMGGGISTEISHQTYNDFFETLLYNEFDVVDTDNELDVADMVFDQASHTLSSSANLYAIAPGQWFKISGTASNDGVYKSLESSTPTTSEIICDPVIKDFTDEASVAGILSSARLVDGTDDQRTFTIEKEFTDVSQMFCFRGMAPISLSLNYAVGAMLTGEWSFLGFQDDPTDVVQSTTTQMPDSNRLPATTTSVFSNVNNTIVTIDGVRLGQSCAESLSLEIANGMREVQCIGSGLSPAAIVPGTYSISGTVNIFFGTAFSASLYNKMLAGTPISIEVVVADENDNSLVIGIHRCKLTSATVESGGTDTEVVMAMGIESTISDDVTEGMITIDSLGSFA